MSNMTCPDCYENPRGWCDAHIPVKKLCKLYDLCFAYVPASHVYYTMMTGEFHPEMKREIEDDYERECG